MLQWQPDEVLSSELKHFNTHAKFETVIFNIVD